MLFGRRELHIGRVDLFGLPTPGKQPKKLPKLRQPDDSVVALAEGAPLRALVHQTAAVDVSVKEQESDSMWRLTVAVSDLADSVDQLDDLLLMCQYDIKPATT